MTDREAYKLIGEKAAEIAKRPEIQKQMLEIANAEGKEAAIKHVYLLAIGTLTGGEHLTI